MPTLWEQGQDAYRKYHHWPNPYKFFMQDMEILSCGPTFQAKVKYVGSEIFNFWFTNFVPSMVEIERRIVMGKYKCGFVLKARDKGRVGIIWKNPAIRTAVIEMSNPWLSGLFYMWAAQTAYDAITTWQSMVLKMSQCGADPHATMIRDGISLLGYGHNDGGAALGDTIQDPEGRASETITGVNCLGGEIWTGNAFGYYLGNNCSSDNVEVFWRYNGEEHSHQFIGHVPIGGVIPFSLGGNTVTTPGIFAPQIRADVNMEGLLRPEFYVVRFTARSGEPERPNYGNVGQPVNFPCWAPQEKLVNVLGLG